MMPYEPASAPVAAEPAGLAPVAVPPYVVAAIARAAVEAYIESEKARARADWKAYYAVNGDEVRRRRKEARDRKRLEQARHRTRS
jgi:hypothetical protein